MQTIWRKKMEYKKLNVNELKPNDYNPNEMTESIFNHLKREYERVGMLQPILINKNHIIIDGEHRWKAAKEMGLEEIPVIIVDISDEDAKITTVNMNQIKGELNPVKFAELLKSLESDYNNEQLAELLNMSELEIENYDMLLNLPDFNEEDFNQDEKVYQIKCPHCNQIYDFKKELLKLKEND